MLRGQFPLSPFSFSPSSLHSFYCLIPLRPTSLFFIPFPFIISFPTLPDTLLPLNRSSCPPLSLSPTLSAHKCAGIRLGYLVQTVTYLKHTLTHMAPETTGAAKDVRRMVDIKYHSGCVHSARLAFHSPPFTVSLTSFPGFTFITVSLQSAQTR